MLGIRVSQRTEQEKGEKEMCRASARLEQTKSKEEERERGEKGKVLSISAGILSCY